MATKSSEGHPNGVMGTSKIAATLDEALIMTGFGLYNICHMLLGGTILMGMIIQSLSLGYVLPAAQCDLALTPRLQGLLVATPFMAMILTSVAWGWVGDTRGRKPLMLYTMLGSVLFAVLASFAPDMPSFAVLHFTSSIFTSGSSAVVYTYIGEFNSVVHRDKMMAFGSSFVGIGTVGLAAISWGVLSLEFSTYIGFLDISYRAWRLLVVVCSLPFFFASIFLFFTPESPKFLHTVGKHEEALEIVKKIYKVNKRAPADSFPVISLLSSTTVKSVEESQSSSALALLLKSLRDQTVPLFQRPLLRWTCLTSFVQFGIFATCNGFYVWFPTILNSLASHEGDETSICAVLESIAPDNGTEVICNDTINAQTFERSIYTGLVFCSMYLIVGILIGYVGKKAILVVTLSATGACGVSAYLVNSQQTAVILFALFQMCGACIGLMNAFTVELFPTKYRAMAVCLSMMMGRVGSMVGSNVVGFLLTTNCGLSFCLFGGIVIACGLICLTLPPKKQVSSEAKTVEPTKFQTHEPA